MSKFKIAFLYIIIIFIAGGINIYAQQQTTDNQYLINKFSLSPVYAGKNGSIETYVNSRQNWMGIPGAPKKQNLNFNLAINEHTGVGLIINNEQTGNYEHFSFLLNYAYHVTLSDAHSLSFGIAAEIYRNQLDLSKIKTQGQDKHIINSQSLSGTTIDATIGILYQFENLDVGILVPRIIGTKLKYSKDTESNYTLSRLFAAHTSYNFILNKKIDIEPFVIVRSTQNSLLLYEIATTLRYNKKLWGSVKYRSDKCIGLSIGGSLDYRLIMNYSYEFGLNGILAMSSGTHEISIGYLIKYGNKKSKSVFQEKPIPPIAKDSKTVIQLKKDFDNYKIDAVKEVDTLRKRIENLEQNSQPKEKKQYKPPYILKNIKFGSHSDKMYSSSFPSIDRLASKMNKTGKMKVKIIGYTDNIGSPRYNVRLSYKRTLAVRNYLLSRGIKLDRIEIESKGAEEPIGDNNTREGRALNNRIVIIEVISKN